MDKDTTATGSVEGKVAHDNWVYLNGYINTSISGVSYNGTMEVTGGQPVDGTPTPSTTSSGYGVLLTCGRHGGTTIATDFANYCGSSTNMFGLNAIMSSPHELNFFFGIDLTISGQSSPVTIYLGQGQNLNGNNWWIGGSGIYYDGSGTATLTLADNSQVTVQSNGEDDYTFLFSSNS